MVNKFLLKELKLVNFRNHKDLNVKNFLNSNIFVGPNACGKTNILEAIYLVATGNSFKNAKNFDFINTGQSSAKIKATINFYFDLQTKKSNSNQYIIIDFDKNKKNYLLNSKSINLKNIKGKFPVVIFTPDDLYLVKGSNSERRNAVDKLGSQISHEYEMVNSNFIRTLRQKNKALKENYDEGIIKALNDIFIAHSVQLIFYRINLLKKIEKKINEIYSTISSHTEYVSINYYVSWDTKKILKKETKRNEINEQIKKYITENNDREKLMQCCMIGPQRDKVEFVIEGYNASRYASQGQQRSLVLAYKLAEMEILSELLSKKPILLLDDVMSELDEKRRELLLSYLGKASQVFITTTNLMDFNKNFLDNSKMYNI